MTFLTEGQIEAEVDGVGSRLNEALYGAIKDPAALAGTMASAAVVPAGILLASLAKVSSPFVIGGILLYSNALRTHDLMKAEGIENPAWHDVLQRTVGALPENMDEAAMNLWIVSQTVDRNGDGDVTPEEIGNAIGRATLAVLPTTPQMQGVAEDVLVTAAAWQGIGAVNEALQAAAPSPNEATRLGRNFVTGFMASLAIIAKEKEGLHCVESIGKALMDRLRIKDPAADAKQTAGQQPRRWPTQGPTGGGGF